jgi:DNA-binding GntR family transcriptional regulator
MRSPSVLEIADEIRDDIFLGHLAAGSRIDQEAIAARSGVSRLPVREALIVLELEGLIEIQPNRGAFVVPIDVVDMQDRYGLYAYVQGMAAARAARTLSPYEMARLERTNRQFAAATDRAEIRLLDRRFHAVVNKAGGSGRLIAVLRQLGPGHPCVSYGMPPEYHRTAVAEHHSILDALRSKDGPLAGRRARVHTLREGAHVVELLSDLGVVHARFGPSRAS